MRLEGDQSFFMTILRETGFIRADQVLPLLRTQEPWKEPHQAEAMLRRLRYLGLLVPVGSGLIALPELRKAAADREMLLALDTLLALEPEKLLQISACPPYKLRFLIQRGKTLDFFAVMTVPDGHEARVCQLLQAEPRKDTFLLLLDRPEQHARIILDRSYYLVLQQDGRLRFCK